MIHTLRVIREESGPIMAALSVFATEPTLDWLKRAEESSRDALKFGREQSSAGDSNWTPDEAIRRTENALGGANPADVTCADLKKNKMFSLGDGQTVLTQLVAVVRGSAGAPDDESTMSSAKRNKPCNDASSYRSSLPSAGLSVEQQVKCGPSKLGRVQYAHDNKFTPLFALFISGGLLDRTSDRCPVFDQIVPRMGALDLKEQKPPLFFWVIVICGCYQELFLLCQFSEQNKDRYNKCTGSVHLFL